MFDGLFPPAAGQSIRNNVGTKFRWPAPLPHDRLAIWEIIRDGQFLLFHQRLANQDGNGFDVLFPRSASSWPQIWETLFYGLLPLSRQRLDNQSGNICLIVCSPCSAMFWQLNLGTICWWDAPLQPTAHNRTEPRGPSPSSNESAESY